MATYPSYGTQNWDTALKSYLDGQSARWIIATDPRYAGGVDPTGATYSDNALDAIYNAVTGTSVHTEPISSLRYATAVILLPPTPGGSIKLARQHEWISVGSLQIIGAGPRATTITFVNATNNLTITGDAWSFISCQDLHLEGFSITGDSTTTVTGSMLGIDCIPTRGYTSAARPKLERVYVEGSGKWVNGIGLGFNSASNDVADVIVKGCHVAGVSMTDPTYWQQAYVLGATNTNGNVLNFTLISNEAWFAAKGFVVNSVNNVSLQGCNASHIGTYLTILGTNTVKASEARIENSARVLVRGPTTSASGFVSFENVTFIDDGTTTAADRQLFQFIGQGTMRFKNVFLDGVNFGSAYRVYIYCNTQTATQQIFVYIEGMRAPNDTIDSMFSASPSNAIVYAEVTGWTQYGTAAGGTTTGNHVGRRSFVFNGAKFNWDRSVAESNDQTGTTYTLVNTDAGKAVTMTNASANTLTIPPNSSVAFPVGTVISVEQLGAGQTAIAAGVGVTLHSRSSLTHISAQYGRALLRQTVTDTWLLTGDLA